MSLTLNIVLSFFWIVFTFIVLLLLSYFAKQRGPFVLIGGYVSTVVISSVTATKIIQIFGFTAPAGTIVFAASFAITDIISECYGKDKAYTAVLCGIFAYIFYFGYSVITIYWPSVPYWTNQESYEAILGLSGRVALAGVAAFVVSQFLDVTIFHWLKEKHGPSKTALAIRNNFSTIISQAIDSLIFVTVAFLGVFPILDLFIGVYLAKVCIAIIDTPFVIIARSIIQKPIVTHQP